MDYSCGCYCGCNTSCGCYQTSCCNCIPCTTTTTTTTTINPDCEPCGEFYNCECIEYSGENISCYGLKKGDDLCSILETIIENLPECKTPPPELNCDFQVSVNPADSVVFKATAITDSKWNVINSTVPFFVNWGDGVIDSFAPGYYVGLTAVQHTYSSAYTGDIKLLAYNLSGITVFYDSDNGVFNFYNGTSVTLEATEFGKLTGLVESELLSVKLLGNVKDIPRSLKTFVCYGRNQSSTITGNVKDLPRKLTFTNIIGQNTLSGNVIDFPRNGSYGTYTFYVLGNNTITGSIQNLPTIGFTSCMLIIEGSNTITGNLSSIPSNYVDFTITGLNTVTGNIANVPNQLVRLWITGNNTVTGNIQQLPSTIETIYVGGLNTVGGTLQNLTAPDLEYITILGASSTLSWDIDTASIDFPLLSIVRIEASTTVTGDIANLPSSIVEFIVIQNLGTLNQYTSGHVFSAGIKEMIIQTPAAFTGSDASDLLIDLETYWTLGTAGNVKLKVTGGEPALTVPGATAKADLITKGATVTIT